MSLVKFMNAISEVLNPQALRMSKCFNLGCQIRTTLSDLVVYLCYVVISHVLIGGAGDGIMMLKQAELTLEIECLF